MTDDRRPIPDLKEVMERARRLDPEAVAEVFGEVEPDAEVLEFVPRDEGPSVALSAFLSDVRTDLDACAEQRSLQSIPPPPQMRPRKRWSLLGAAAVLLLVGGGAAWSIGQTRGGAAPSQAVEMPYQASEAMPLPLAEPKSRDAEPATQLTEAPEPSEALPSPQPPVEAINPTKAGPAAAPSRKTKAQPKASELADLEKKAYAAWSAGQLDEAEREISALGHPAQLVADEVGQVVAPSLAQRRAKAWQVLGHNCHRCTALGLARYIAVGLGARHREARCRDDDDGADEEQHGERDERRAAAEPVGCAAAHERAEPGGEDEQ